MELEIFEGLGLTRTEIIVYTKLLEIGSSSVGKILEKSKLPNSTVHRDLNTLIEKGLINFVFEGKRKIYQASDPEYFLNYLDEKKRQFQEILKELKQKQKMGETEETAIMYKGKRGIKEVYKTMITQKAKEYNTFGGGPITSEVMGFAWWLNLHKERVKNRLPSRQIFDESVKQDGKEIEKLPLTKIRYVDKEFAQFQETVIVGNVVAIAVFAENPYAFLIIDRHVSNSYRKYFELLWKSAK